MNELSAGWSEYYRELEPARRRELLDALCASEPDDGANAFRRRLFDARYAPVKGKGGVADRFLYHSMSFMQHSQNARLFKGHVARQVKSALKEMLVDEAAVLGEAGERALYWELWNTAMRFFDCCDSPAYNRQLFGLIPSGDESRRSRICRDVWRMTRGIARYTGLETQLEPWCRAVLDAYQSLDRDAQRRFEEYDRSMGG